VGEVCIDVINESCLHIPSENQTFSFDYVFGQESAQVDIYEKVGKGAIDDVLEGYNATILAYGQTGSGKTYTMFGEDILEEQLKGIIPRAASDIFKVWDVNSDVKEVAFSCSMLEIYKEELRDLLNEESSELKIKESPSKGIYVEGLTENPITEEYEIIDYIYAGEERRVWAETRQNAVSSRSHTIFRI
jgi:kinesin family member 5